MFNSVQQSFNQAAKSYDRFAFLQQQIAAHLSQRLARIHHVPSVILDVGCGTGIMAQQLQSFWPEVSIVGVDFAWQMCQQAHPLPVVCGRAQALPIADASVDLVVSNCMLQWLSDELTLVFQEMRRVLKPGGLLIFSTFGPDTLQELRHAWASVDQAAHVNSQLDMHDVGDALAKVQMQDVVMDRWPLTLQYESVKAVVDDIRGVGGQVVHARNTEGLMTRTKWQSMCQAYQKNFSDAEGHVLASYEVIFGHAWAPKSTGDAVPLSALKRPSQS